MMSRTNPDEAQPRSPHLSSRAVLGVGHGAAAGGIGAVAKHRDLVRLAVLHLLGDAGL